MRLTERRLRRIIREEIKNTISERYSGRVEVYGGNVGDKRYAESLVNQIYSVGRNRIPERWEATVEVLDDDPEFETEYLVNVLDPQFSPGDRTAHGFSIMCTPSRGEYQSMPQGGWSKTFNSLDRAVKHSLDQLGL